MSASTLHLGIFYMPQIYDMGLHFPSEGRRAGYFFALKNPTVSAGFEPANLGTRDQHATSRPPKPLCLLCYTPGVWNRIKLAFVLPCGRLKDLLQLSCSLYNQKIKQIAVLKFPLRPSLSFSYFIRCSYDVSHWQRSKALPDYGRCTSLSSVPRKSLCSPNLCAPPGISALQSVSNRHL
jgi:hypothetical protein